MAGSRLFAPGPTPVPDSVRLAMAQPIIHHRTKAFAALMEQVRTGLRWIMQTQQEVLCLAGTGTLAMEAAVTNLLSPGDVALYVSAGKFGERWGSVLQAYGVQAVPIEVPWGQAVDPQQVAQALATHPTARAVYLQACETSTGTQHPVRQVAQICRAHGEVLCVVDGITAVGVMDVALDRDQLDVLLSGSQKAFMLPPGLAFIGLSERAWRAVERAQLPRFYVDLKRERRAAITNQTAWTTPVSLWVGLHEALRLHRAEGLDRLFARHQHMAAACRAGLQAAGCTLYSQAPAAGLTAVRPPAGVAAAALIAELRDAHDLVVVGGQDAAKGKIVRLSHMGYVDRLDILTLVGATELALTHLGGATPGAGIAAAQAVLAAT